MRSFPGRREKQMSNQFAEADALLLANEAMN
jgi:hypothetical protein